MSVKSILLSLLSLVLFLGFIIGIVFLFKTQFILGFIGIFLEIIPIKIHQKAVDEANGGIDKIFAKYVVPVLALIGIVFIILLFTLWM
ncbi:MAG: hypothetical protein J5689_00545 [Clostridia bacterium]|nr:hypothetical protein [Clostridia bacterium]